MAHWMIKAAVQGALSRLPRAQAFNNVLQHFNRSHALGDARFITKWQQCVRHLDRLDPDVRARGFAALELGTGWHPITAIGLALSGATRVLSVDLQPLLAHPQVLATTRMYRKHIERGNVRVPDPAAAIARLDDVLARAEHLDATAMLRALGVELMIADARRLPLPDQSIDLLVSNNTLEHIPAVVIAGIFDEFRRVAAPAAVMSHYIDMADHYRSFDRRITVYNFLAYSDRSWALFNNALQYQNRLRLPDFRALVRASRWAVVDEENSAEPLDVLRRVRLAPQFRGYDEADLAVYATWMTSRTDVAA